VSHMRAPWEVKRVLRLAAVCLALITAAFALSACGTPAEEEGGEDAATVEPIKGTHTNLVILKKEASETLGIKTTAIKKEGGREVLPDAALVYAAEGHTFTYSSPKPNQYVRAEVTVDRIDGRKVILKKGPPAGTKVVTVGSQELVGLENEYEPE
jgi:hypothetical protein